MLQTMPEGAGLYTFADLVERVQVRLRNPSPLFIGTWMPQHPAAPIDGLCEPLIRT